MNNQPKELHVVLLQVEHPSGRKQCQPLSPYLPCLEEAEAALSLARQRWPEARLWTFKDRRTNASMEVAQ